ncbi:MAG: RDD family protein [Flavobacteriales bacterium]
MDENEIKDLPHVSERVKATFADGMVMVVLATIASYTFSTFENVHDLARIGTMIFIVLLYEPLMICTFGASIGHMIMGIQVRDESNPDSKINYFQAQIRGVFKLSLGWISLLSVGSSEKKQAIHDMIVGSIVLYKTKKD